ncbi:hypothetical protein NHX12_001148 [Muraenolepis orangiensis]|uniref:Acid sphingomyelinase-like phosphodiesterase n=1 Tax=Muraenolepis orangiensis TaxID=630683 RepID=A0A9Q0E1J2_9TELE|nr:hypothetical protein NHX12_001148 [Muraenolepis orangiensis]
MAAFSSMFFLVCLFLEFQGILTLSGTFWHITDQHLDPSYDSAASEPEAVCASSGQRPAVDAGQFGAYVCDSPWRLINSSVYAMKQIMPDPDFILWTGDDTPHVPDQELGVDKVLQIVRNLTDTIKHVFPNTKVYSALGNHDHQPKNQFPAASSYIYHQLAQMWSDWLEPSSQLTFKKGGYYTERLVGRTGYRIMVLNTNLYYDQNKLTRGMEDPADQFHWAEEVLTEAARNKERVYIIGHVPPGFFEKKRGKPWFRPEFNQRYVDMVQRHHAVIQGQFFGHHHTDSFRMFYDSDEHPISTMFLCPGVTPWKTTLPGVIDGANNPGIRSVEYDTQTLLVKDLVTYYLNLTRSNLGQGGWEKEYRLTESFGVADASPASMHRVLGRMAGDNGYLQKYYAFNSVNYDLSVCDAACRVDHVCAARAVDFGGYRDCLDDEERGGAAGVVHGTSVSVLVPMAISVVWWSW